MEHDLETIVDHPDRRISRGRRRSDDVAHLPGHDDYIFMKQYFENSDISPETIPVEQLKGILQYVEALEHHARTEAENARTDALTQIPNKFGLEEELGEMTREANANSTNMTFLFYDIDGFKEVNTKYDHTGGDQILMALGKAIRESIRPQDFAGRVGGEEFATVLHDTSLEEGLRIAARMKERIQSYMDRMSDGKEIPCTVTLSMGAANFTGNASNVHELVDKAKNAMNSAKRIDGKNSIMYHNEKGNLTIYQP